MGVQELTSAGPMLDHQDTELEDGLGFHSSVAKLAAAAKLAAILSSEES